MRFLKANGLVIHVVDEGDGAGPPIVFINALGCDLRIWTEVALLLRPGFRIIRYDTRGHGLSESGQGRNDMADYALDLAALLDKLSIDRAALVGVSFGGLIAQELYRQRPDLLAALVLSDTAAKIGTDESWDARIAAVERGGVESIADTVLERWFTAAFRSCRLEDFAGFRAMLTRTPKQGYIAACGALKRADLRVCAGAIKAPTLCLVGDEDGSTPVAVVRETASLIKGSRFEVVEGAGHLPCVEKPGVTARLIGEHVRAAF